MADKLGKQKDEDALSVAKMLSESTGHLLISLNKSLLDRLNGRQYDSTAYQDVLDPDIHIELHGRMLKGPQGFVDGYKDVADLSPGLHVSITNSSAIVDERLDKATVLLHLNLTGFLEETRRAGTILSCWRRHEDGRWTSYAYHMFYGIQEFH
ncbi:hypothetical protein M409DRAFT_26183 [Zasmidium cellare ATCC 36951]|uniref:SnoaL-like domain-containing protein n=1 Tax=Zasmidium cellare ATCC 36951 TaxID=1080233 RepID=A0A6A6C9S5_ZASCE|nr:uncharacterized protein M409DRAFT_26183 [Zasmidium cellare ATCC 36951]KAF2163573.1 hypothetical protein M409DRAFT_26183 [Zasmidium cellare ATCC 36951]